MAQRPIAYLISQYPALSHTFILREIRRLRTLGMQIRAASINDPDRPQHMLDADEIEESENTFYIKKQGFLQASRAFFSILFTSPLRVFKGVRTAFSLAGYNFQRVLKHVAYLGEAALVGRWVHSQGITHIHVHFANPASVVAMLACDLFPLTYSITVHGPDEFYDVTLNSLEKKIKKARFVFCVSYYTQSQLMKLSSIHEWHKLHVVRLGVDTGVFAPRRGPVCNRPCQILCVGRLVPAKGQQILIAAFEKVIRDGKNAQLRFAGGGPDYLELEKEIFERKLQGKVILSGPLNPWQVKELYSDADIFVLSSFAEGLPVALMEAMAMEVVCVASCVNGIPELIRHNIEGLLVAPSNIEQLAQSLELLIEDEDLRNRLGKAGRERVLELYDLDKNTKLLHRYMDNLLN